MSLFSWGWRDEAFLPGEGLELGRVIAGFGERCTVVTEEEEVSATISGRLHYFADSPAELPVVGDWVILRQVLRQVLRQALRQAVVERVLPRRTALRRRAAGTRSEEQVLAANVDTVFIVSGLDDDWNVRRLERYLVVVLESGAKPVLILNKADLCPDAEPVMEAARGIAGGAEVLLVSAMQGAGAAEIAARLAPGETGALIGSSGAGKSTLLNCLMGRDAQAVREVRETDSRGRHTTTHRQLFRLADGGLLIDQPGLREVQLWTDPGGVGDAFPEIRVLAQACRFPDCRHQGEPDCAVRAALEAGALDEARLLSFHKLVRETQRLVRETDPLAAGRRKREMKRISRSMRRFYRE